jgi:hypothetical protein
MPPSRTTANPAPFLAPAPNTIPTAASSSKPTIIRPGILTDAATAAAFFGTPNVGADAVAAVARYRADCAAWCA